MTRDMTMYEKITIKNRKMFVLPCTFLFSHDCTMSHISRIVDMVVHTYIYIHMALSCLLMRNTHCVFWIVFVLHSQKLDAISNKCIKIPLVKYRQVAGIFSVNIVDDPDFINFQKPICISNTPSIIVTINNVTINLLNQTLSDEGCRDLYEKFLCAKTKTILPNRCREAHHVVFAIIQSLPECTTDKDCETPYKLNGLECNWISDLQYSVCEASTVNSTCEKDKSKAVYIQNMCYLTDSTCQFIVTNMVVLSILTGLSWALLTISFIYSCQYLCDKVQLVENRVDSVCEGVHFSRNGTFV